MSVFFKVGSEICKACTNKSTAKYQYSFSKAERFPGTKLKTKEEKEKEKEEEEKRKQEEKEKIKNKQYVKHDYYLLPSTLNSRGTNFGFGERTDFTGSVRYNKLSKSQKISESKENKDLTPEEQKKLKEKQLYQFAEYEYERKYFHGPQYSIPKSGMTKIKNKKKEKEENEENKDEKNGKDNKDKKDDSEKDLVGPGRYNITKSFGYDAPKYSIKGIPDAKIEEMKKEVQKRINEYNEKVSKERKPVPPHEEQVTIQIRSNGKYASSTIPNVHSFRIEKPNKYLEEQKKKLEKNKKEGEEEDKEEKEKEKEKAKEKIPDPLISDSKNHKEIKKYLNSLMGANFPSKFRTHEAITFGTKKEVKGSTDNYPGPGSYIMPSDFGIYLTKDYNDASKYPQDNVFVEKKKEQDPHPWRHGMKKIKPKKEEEEPDYQEPENENKEEENNEEIHEENQEQEKKEEEKSPLPENEPKKEEPIENKDIDLDKDKESEYMMLRDILEYHDGN